LIVIHGRILCPQKTGSTPREFCARKVDSPHLIFAALIPLRNTVSDLSEGQTLAVIHLYNPIMVVVEDIAKTDGLERVSWAYIAGYFHQQPNGADVTDAIVIAVDALAVSLATQLGDPG
jgi:hypothetical protein